jgi:hypothetical protein
VAVFLATLAQIIAVVIPLLATQDRFRRPFGEKFMFSVLGGSGDLWVPYLGAQAITEGIDPYGPRPAHLHDPGNWPLVYPPMMLTLYLPLVWATHANIEKACQAFYWINMLALAALSFIVWRLSLRLMGPVEKGKSSFLLLVIALSLNALTMFAVDRGQSEIIGAALCWGGILLYLNEWPATALALVTIAGALKGYAVPVGLGLLVTTRGWRPFLRALAGGAGAALALSLPVLKYLKQGFAAMAIRTDFAWESNWFNHSFKNAFYQHAPKHGDDGRRLMILLTLSIMLGALARLLCATRKGTKRDVTVRVTTFAGAAMALMIGLPAYSGPYNYLFVLPALLLLSTRYHDVAELLDLRGIWLPAVGAGLGLATLWALKLRTEDGHVSLAADGLVLFVLCLGVVTALPGPRCKAPANDGRG